MSLIINFFLLIFFILLIFFLSTILRYSNIISSNISRKLIHIFIAPTFMFFLSFFPDNFFNRFFLSSLPITISLIFYFSAIHKNIFSNVFCKIMSRSGDINELLLGPFFYGIIVGIVTFIYYTNEPIGVISIVNLCFGDGTADLFGSYFKSKRLFSPFGKKTIFGCLAFVFFSVFMGTIFCGFLFGKMFLINNFFLAIVGCLAEFFSSPKFDNIFIVLCVCFVGKFLDWK